MPDLFPLLVDGDPNNIKWVYTASGDWYVIGRLEKDKVKMEFRNINSYLRPTGFL